MPLADLSCAVLMKTKQRGARGTNTASMASADGPPDLIGKPIIVDR